MTDEKALYYEGLYAETRLPIELICMITDYTNAEYTTKIEERKYVLDTEESDVQCYGDTYISKRRRVCPTSNIFEENALMTFGGSLLHKFEGRVAEDPATWMFLEVRDGSRFTVWNGETLTHGAGSLDASTDAGIVREFAHVPAFSDKADYALSGGVVHVYDQGCHVIIDDRGETIVDDIGTPSSMRIRSHRMMWPRAVEIGAGLVWSSNDISKIHEDVPVVLLHRGDSTRVMSVDMITGNMKLVCKFDGYSRHTLFIGNTLVIPRGSYAIVVERTKNRGEPERYLAKSH